MRLPAGPVVFAAVAIGGAVFFWQSHHPRSAYDKVPGQPELIWLQEEFRLSPVAMDRITQLHHGYTAECERMCEQINANDAAVRQLVMANRTITPKLEAALDRSSLTAAMCQRRMLEHFYDIAREMPEAEAQRYLTMMSPMVEHPAAPAPMHAH